MTTEASLINCDAIRGTFHQWQAEQEPLAAELAESLSALSAYQAHLDAWQGQLAGEREQLRAERERFDTERASTVAAEDQSLAECTAELEEAREKINSLTGALLARTDELRALDSRRAEVATELELARAREKEFSAKLEELKHSRDEERAQWSAEMRHLRELLERRLETGGNDQGHAAAERPPAKRSSAELSGRVPSNSPVLGSIVEQFGKLRQQRSLDRSAHHKSR